MEVKPNKPLIISAALLILATSYAVDNIHIDSKHEAKNSQGARYTIPKEPDKNWKISAEDYAKLLEECGETKDSDPTVENKVSGVVSHR